MVNSECESSLKNCESLISHSFLHLPLSSLHTKDLINDIEQNKFYLNNEFKKLRVVNSSFCLPFGDINSFNDEVLEILSVSGYDTVYASNGKFTGQKSFYFNKPLNLINRLSLSPSSVQPLAIQMVSSYLRFLFR